MATLNVVNSVDIINLLYYNFFILVLLLWIEAIAAFLLSFLAFCTGYSIHLFGLTHPSLHIPKTSNSACRSRSSAITSCWSSLEIDLRCFLWWFLWYHHLILLLIAIDVIRLWSLIRPDAFRIVPVKWWLKMQACLVVWWHAHFKVTLRLEVWMWRSCADGCLGLL